MRKPTAQLNYLRIAPRKVRLVTDVIKGMTLTEAQFQLRYMTKRCVPHIQKLLNSAAANMVSNRGLNKDHLYIQDIAVDEGIKLKRFMPKGFSMVMPIQKKTSRVRVVLDELPESERARAERFAMPEAKESSVEPAEEEIRTDESTETKKEAQKVMPEREVAKGKKKGVLGGIKRLFRRKAV